MITRPRLKASFSAHAVGDNLVFLLNEHKYFALEGNVYPLLLPLLDGNHSIEQIIAALGTQVPFPKLYYALHLLEQRGYIVEANGESPAPLTAFWDYLGVDPHEATARLQQARVRILALPPCDPAPLAQALQALGISATGDDAATEPPDLTLVLTDDYLRPELQAFNQQALDAALPWLPIKPVGTLLWLGPVFRPGATACWECLAQRLRANRQVEAFIQKRTGSFDPLPTSRAALPSTQAVAFQLAATEVARFLVLGLAPALDNRLLTWDHLSLERQEHVLVQRPQCPACGDPAYKQSRPPQPVRLQSQLKRSTEEGGGHRTASPEETFERYKHHISPITGAVSGLTRLYRDERGLAFAYSAGHNFAMGIDSLTFLQESLRGHSGGKGTTEMQAKTSGLCEAIERYSGIFWGNEYRIKSSYKALQPDAIHPNACTLFSEQQYRVRDHWNATQGATKYHVVPRPLDENQEIDWTPIWSLTHNRWRYLPTAYCYYGHPDFQRYYFFSPDSNGSAAGNVLEEAILQGFMELVERDAIAIWWYNRIPRPAVDLDSFGLPYVQQLREFYAGINREFWVLDCTHDLGIPTLAAVCRRTDREVEDIVLGFGAHFDPNIALLRALTEVNQFMPSVTMHTSDGGTRYLFPDQGAIDWWKTATIANQPYLAPAKGMAPVKFSDYPPHDSNDLKDDVERCVEIAAQQGLETLVLDQTQPDIGLAVAKVFVPGLRHFWRRLGPGRLYDVPVKLGWLEKPMTEDELNPRSVFF
jgi:bacteriocin biosynthesis cyclodehydratase domain-containing protein